MLPYLSDHASLFCALFVLASLVIAFVWFRTGQSKILWGLAVTLPLALLIGLLPHLSFGETDSQVIERKIRAMGDAVRHRQVNDIFANVSSSFQYQGHDKDSLRQFAERHIGQLNDVTDMDVWEFEPGEISRSKRHG